MNTTGWRGIEDRATGRARRLALGMATHPPESPRHELSDKGGNFIQGITQGSVEATDVIAWADEVIGAAPKAEDWMIEISTCGPGDRMVILSHLNTIKGVADPVELAALLAARK